MATVIKPKTGTKPGMGATVHSAGTTFRVWAPDVHGVAVAGSFNGWSDSKDPLVHEEHGYWSADIPNVGPGAEYRFVIEISPGHKQWRIDPYAKETTNSVGNGIVVDESFDWSSDHFTMPNWNELVIYELHTGTFNDFEPLDPKPAMFNNTIQALPYLRELGVNAIKVLPSSEFPGDHSWGYNPTHLFAVERAYGGVSALKRFVKAAHQHGLAVILDVVYNHFGPGDLDSSLWRFNGWSENDGGGIYFFNDWRSRTPWGEKNRPDYGRAEVRQFIRDNALYWLQECRIDGLRFDATAYIRGVDYSGPNLPEGWSLLQWINDEIDTHQGWKLTIAEDLQNNEWVTKHNNDGGAGFDSQWDAGFVHPVRETLIKPSDDWRDLNAVTSAIYSRYNGDAFQRVIYTESHDEVAAKNGKSRLPTAIDSAHPGGYFAKKRSTLGAALAMTSPGIPMIFQGQEFVEDLPWDDNNPLDWRKVKWFAGIVRLYRDLIRLRRDWHNNTAGLSGQHVNVHHQNHQDKVIGFHRWKNGGPGDDVVVLMNFSNRSFSDYRFGVPHAGDWRVRFNSDSHTYSPDFGNTQSFDTVAQPIELDGMSNSATIGLGPYSCLILSQ